MTRWKVLPRDQCQGTNEDLRKDWKSDLDRHSQLRGQLHHPELEH